MTTKKKVKTAAEKLAAARRAQDAFTIYMPGPLKAEWNRVSEEFDRENRKVATGMLNEGALKQKLAAQMAKLEDQMREDAIEVTLEALRRQRTPSTPKDATTWNELVKAHPPRKGKDSKPLPEDSPGVNMETFPEALIKASVVDPEFTDEEWEQLLGEVMNDAQYDQLFAMCWRLNKSGIDVPFSSAASRTLNSGGESNRQND
ncbi:hypothetical protein [Glycomyces tenuis]|uniref:hypothetical protein n=1 Tax=Glycomyces tenuis TaxID=58116 RepID=UPI000423E663|nr:hypothetical protein [Glycomyces tenuis]